MWDAYLIKPKAKISSESVLFFLATCLQKAIKDKFGYDDKCIWEKVRQLTVSLPATSDEEPDFAYMETYIAKIEERVKSAARLLAEVSEPHYNSPRKEPAN